MRTAIVGAGGTGGYFGGLLAQANEDVTFVARGAHADAPLLESVYAIVNVHEQAIKQA